MSKAIEFDLAEVERLAAEGYTQPMLAGSFGCSVRTIRNRLADEDGDFALAHARGRCAYQAEIHEAAMRMIRNPDHPDHGRMVQLALKTQLGWVESPRPVHVTGELEHTHRTVADVMREANGRDVRTESRVH